jgi:hypothetical protein
MKCFCIGNKFRMVQQLYISNHANKLIPGHVRIERITCDSVRGCAMREGRWEWEYEYMRNSTVIALSIGKRWKKQKKWRLNEWIHEKNLLFQRKKEPYSWMNWQNPHFPLLFFQQLLILQREKTGKTVLIR